MKYSKDRVVRFDPETHSYWDGERRLTGVTTFISRHHEKFDMEMQAAKFAEKNGLIKEEVIKAWEAKGKQARDDGTSIHRVFENYIETGKIAWDKGNMKQIVAIKFIKDYFMSERLVPVECEMVVYGDKLASMIDCIAVNDKGEYFILDWKSSKEISKNGFGRTMYDPYGEYPDANFYHYSIQVSIYRQLCKEYKIKDAFIVHIGTNDYEIIQAKNILTHKCFI